MNKKLQKILEDIYKMDSADIQSIVDAVKLRRNQLHLQDAQSFRVGDTVFFRGRRNTLCEAKVEKIKIKNVLVRTLLPVVIIVLQIIILVKIIWI